MYRHFDFDFATSQSGDGRLISADTPGRRRPRRYRIS